jgi:hypothetical protein
MEGSLTSVDVAFCGLWLAKNDAAQREKYNRHSRKLKNSYLLAEKSPGH